MEADTTLPCIITYLYTPLVSITCGNDNGDIFLASHYLLPPPPIYPPGSLHRVSLI